MRLKRSGLCLLLLASFMISGQSRHTYWYTHIDNDITAQTDHQYTAGFTFSWFSEKLTAMPQLRILPAHRHFTQAGVEAEIMLFTPRSIFTLPPPADDRPYSSTFIVRSVGRSFLANTNTWYEAGLGLGMIGPSSQVWRFQNLIHALTPHSQDAVGWDKQIADALIIQYELAIKQSLWTSSWSHFLGDVEARVGSGFVDAALGMEIRFGKMHALSDEYSRSADQHHFYFFWRSQLGAVAYNITLQSSMIGSEAVDLYREPVRDVGRMTAGMVYRFPRMSLQLSQDFWSPEFVGGPFHSWGRLALVFYLDDSSY